MVKYKWVIERENDMMKWLVMAKDKYGYKYELGAMQSEDLAIELIKAFVHEQDAGLTHLLKVNKRVPLPEYIKITEFVKFYVDVEEII